MRPVVRMSQRSVALYDVLDVREASNHVLRPQAKLFVLMHKGSRGKHRGASLLGGVRTRGDMLGIVRTMRA